MYSILERADPPVRADTLVIMLPPAHGTVQDWVDQGFVSAWQQQGLPLDLQLVDAHIDHYTAQGIVKRLNDEVIVPAHEQGYRHLWLGGISLGGYGCLMFARQYPSLVDGLFLIAPFLGRRDLPAAIARAGGLSAWQGEYPEADGDDLALWQWLRAHTRTCGSQTRPALHLAYGEADRFAFSHRLLAEALTPNCVHVTPGGHEWTPWLQLWKKFLMLNTHMTLRGNCDRDLEQGLDNHLRRDSRLEGHNERHATQLHR